MNALQKQSLRIKANDDLSSLHDNTVVVPANKASNNIVVFIKKYIDDVLSINNLNFVHWISSVCPQNMK